MKLKDKMVTREPIRQAISIDIAIHKQLKQIAANTGRKLKYVADEAIQFYLDERLNNNGMGDK
jgi:predicted transcriptional regulator